MQNPTAWLLFALFAVILFVAYIALRRRRGSPVLVSVLTIVGGVVVMTLNGLAQGTSVYQALFVGLMVGGLFSLGTVAMAWYFTSSERRAAAYPPPTPPGES